MKKKAVILLFQILLLTGCVFGKNGNDATVQECELRKQSPIQIGDYVIRGYETMRINNDTEFRVELSRAELFSYSNISPEPDNITEWKVPTTYIDTGDATLVFPAKPAGWKDEFGKPVETEGDLFDAERNTWESQEIYWGNDYDYSDNPYIEIHLVPYVEKELYARCNKEQRTVETDEFVFEVISIDRPKAPKEVRIKENEIIVEANLHGPASCDMAYEHQCREHATWNQKLIQGDINAKSLKSLKVVEPTGAINQDLMESGPPYLTEKNLRARLYIVPDAQPKGEKYMFVHVFMDGEVYKVLDIEWLGEALEYTEEQTAEKEQPTIKEYLTSDTLIWENDILEKRKVCYISTFTGIYDECATSYTYYKYKDGRTETDQLDAVIPPAIQDAFNPLFKPYASNIGPWTLMTPDEDYLLYKLYMDGKAKALMSYNILDGSSEELMTFLGSTYGVYNFVWSPNGEKLAFIAFNETYRHGTKIFVLSIFMGSIDEKKGYDVPVDFSCASDCFAVLKDNEGNWINDTDAFKWIDENTIQYPSYDLEKATNFLETIKLLTTDNMQIPEENLTYETPEQFELTTEPQDAVFHVGLGWTGGPAGAPILNLETGRPYKYKTEGEIYLDDTSLELAEVKYQEKREKGTSWGYMKVSANIQLVPGASGTTSTPPLNDGDAPISKGYTALHINKLYDVLPVDMYGDKPVE